MSRLTPIAVTIAGSDSGGGAGAQADLKTFQARKVFGMNVFVAVTAQNTLGVQRAMVLPKEMIESQFQSLRDDFTIKASKTGMLANTEVVETVVHQLKRVQFGPLVVDPVMIAKGGHPLLSPDAVESIKRQLLPIATVVTPNLPEAEVLLERKIKTEAEMMQAAAEFQKLGVPNVIIKGGHQLGETSSDFVLLENGDAFWMLAKRVHTKNTHGTGDTFSACIAAELAKGETLRQAIITGKKFVQGAIKQEIFVGQGHGPTNHWATLDEEIEIRESK